MSWLALLWSIVGIGSPIIVGNAASSGRTPTHELQRLGAWKTTAMVERYAHIAPDALKGATGRLENFMSGYDLATVSQKEKSPTSL
ncbi:MAG: hypothetical protein Q8L73_03025 [Methylotenera sp.]|nr:hypothetical protein [Methylotenera sp.]